MQFNANNGLVGQGLRGRQAALILTLLGDGLDPGEQPGSPLALSWAGTGARSEGMASSNDSKAVGSMENTVVPELAVTDWQASKRFYCDRLGFECVYERPEEGFCYLRRQEPDLLPEVRQYHKVELMLDQIGLGRTFDNGTGPWQHPLGRGMNLQIRILNLFPLYAKLNAAQIPLFLDLEEKWYRTGDGETGVLQFVVADPDGYLLRFYEPLPPREA